MSEATHDSAVLLLTSIVGDITIVVMHDSTQFPPPPQFDDDLTDSEQPPVPPPLPPAVNGTVTKPTWNPFHLSEPASVKPRGRVDVLPAIAERNSPVSLSDAGSERGLNGGELCNGFRRSWRQCWSNWKLEKTVKLKHWNVLDCGSKVSAQRSVGVNGMQGDVRILRFISIWKGGMEYDIVNCTLESRGWIGKAGKMGNYVGDKYGELS